MTNRERFKANIRLFEVEPHSYCNRKCWFCPNSVIDRTGPVKFLNWRIYTQVIKDLAEIDYSESMSFGGWCEPFSQARFLDYLKEARGHLPQASTFSNTNTDYLTTEIVQDVADIGLGLLKAQLYFDEDEEYTRENICNKMDSLQSKLPDIEFVEKDTNHWFALVDNMVIVAYSKDFRKVGHNRCDLQVRKPRKRYHTCGEPIQMFGVNHNGWAVPCCNIRSDYPPHKDVLLGKMDDKPGRIFELYQGVFLPEDQYPCSTCMGKEWHANHKIVYTEIISEMRNVKQDRRTTNYNCPCKVGSK